MFGVWGEDVRDQLVVLSHELVVPYLVGVHHLLLIIQHLLLIILILIFYHLSFITVIYYSLNAVYFFFYVDSCLLFEVQGVGVRDQLVVLSHEFVIPYLGWGSISSFITHHSFVIHYSFLIIHYSLCIIY